MVNLSNKIYSGLCEYEVISVNIVPNAAIPLCNDPDNDRGMVQSISGLGFRIALRITPAIKSFRQRYNYDYVPGHEPYPWWPRSGSRVTSELMDRLLEDYFSREFD